MIKLSFITALLLAIAPLFSEGPIITNSLKGGRLGVQIMFFSKAFLISKLYKIPFKYTPYPYFDELSIEKYFPELSVEEKGYLKPYVITTIEELEDLMQKSGKDVLYVTNNKTRLNVYKMLKEYPEYKKELQQILKPKDLVFSPLPKDKLTVAVHVRTGRGRDGPFLQDQQRQDPSVTYEDDLYPRRFLPLTFYLNELQFIYSRFKGPLYVRIFTDDPDPVGILKVFQKVFENRQITFFDSSNMPDYKSCVISDCWEMSRFDCLVRPDSDFSQLAEFLGDHKLVIYPKKAHFEGVKLVIDKIIRDARKEGGKRSLIKMKAV